MPNFLPKKRYLSVMQAALLCIIIQTTEATGNIKWLLLESKHTIVHYQSPKDLPALNNKIKFGPKHQNIDTLLSLNTTNEISGTISNKIDALFERAQEILGMRKKMRRVNIFVFQNKNQLHKAYAKQYQGPCNIRGWYKYKTNSVYINLEDLHEGLLAHELAHAIIDHYLLVRPPSPSAEILARYVDKHLKK